MHFLTRAMPKSQQMEQNVFNTEKLIEKIVRFEYNVDLRAM